MKTTVVLRSEVCNVATKFSSAIWRKIEVNRIFPSVKAMKVLGYNPKNCNYDIVNDNDIVIRSVRNGNIDSYGNRYN